MSEFSDIFTQRAKGLIDAIDGRPDTFLIPRNRRELAILGETAKQEIKKAPIIAAAILGGCSIVAACSTLLTR